LFPCENFLFFSFLLSLMKSVLPTLWAHVPFSPFIFIVLYGRLISHASTGAPRNPSPQPGECLDIKESISGSFLLLRCFVSAQCRVSRSRIELCKLCAGMPGWENRRGLWGSKR
jgi:hypothetical protein